MSDLKVIFEDNHLLVVDKPPLLATMGAAEGEDSLYLQAQTYIKKKYNKPGNVYVGVVSRIDAFVSGVIVLARTSKAASRLSDQFRRGVVEKRYLAIIPDHLNSDRGSLEDFLVKNESRHRMEVVPDANHLPKPKLARLSYSTKGICKGLRLIEIELETGRKHQIRVQLENAGCPIIGDRKYGSKKPFHKGIALHCHRLSFEHPTKKVVQSFESEPPSWWNLDRFSIS